MELICKLAQEKGFQPITFSTKWVYNFYIGIGKNIKITEMADYILLCEIQKWLRDIKKIDLIVVNAYVRGDYNKYSYVARYVGGKDIETKDFYSDSYEESLKEGLKEMLNEKSL